MEQIVHRNETETEREIETNLKFCIRRIIRIIIITLFTLMMIMKMMKKALGAFIFRLDRVG